MDKKTIRKMNVRILQREAEGSLTELAKRAGTTQSYLSQCVGEKAVREVGDEIARRLEFAMGKPVGWLDQPHITDEKQEKVRAVFDRLLQMPMYKVDAVMDLLDLRANEHEGELGRISKNAMPPGRGGHRVAVLKDDVPTRSVKSNKAARK